MFDFVLRDPLDAGTVRFAVDGIRSGNTTMTLPPAVLRDLGYVPGVRVSGRLRSAAVLPGGVLRVRGQEAARCMLRLRNSGMRGRVARRTVDARLGPEVFDMALAPLVVGFAGPASAASVAAAVHG